MRHALLDAQVRFPAQFLGVPASHDEAPSQEPAGVSVRPLQEALPQVVPTARTRHCPPPLQEPSVPQLLPDSTAHSLSGSCAAGTGTQRPESCPVLACEQAWQVPGQLFSQHTPSTQAPERHALLPEQAEPSVFLFWQTSVAQ